MSTGSDICWHVTAKAAGLYLLRCCLFKVAGGAVCLKWLVVQLVGCNTLQLLRKPAQCASEENKHVGVKSAHRLLP